MPHVKIGYPHKTKDGAKRSQGDIVYVSPQEARDLVDGGKGKVVKPSPDEIVALDRERKEKEAKAAKAKAPRQQSAPQEAKEDDTAKGEPKEKEEFRGEHGPELPASKAPAKLKAPQAKTEKPADG